MSIAVVPSSIEKIKRSQFLTYLDTTPASTATYAILGFLDAKRPLCTW